MLRHVRWILFDAVGTLLYPDPPVAEVYRAAGQQFGSRLSISEIGERFRTALAATLTPLLPTNEARELDRWRQIVSAVFDDVPDAGGGLFKQLWQHFAQPQHWRLYGDVAPALTALASRGYQLGIASNFDARLHAIVRGHPPLACCERIFVSSEIGFAKPDPRFFAAVTTQLDVQPAKIFLVGDDDRADLAGARTAGWQAVLLCRENNTPHTGVIETLSRLADS